MLILGLLLLAATAAFTGLVLADNLSGGPDYDVTVLGHHIATMNSLSIFCAGLALALIFSLAVMTAASGAALRRRRMRKLHEARRERDELAARLDRTTASAEPAAESAHSAYAKDSPHTDQYTGEYTDQAAYADGSADPAAEPAGSVRADTPRHRHARHLFGH